MAKILTSYCTQIILQQTGLLTYRYSNLWMFLSLGPIDKSEVNFLLMNELQYRCVCVCVQVWVCEGACVGGGVSVKVYVWVDVWIFVGV